MSRPVGSKNRPKPPAAVATGIDELLTPQQAAEYLKLSVKYLEFDRSAAGRKHVRFVRLAGRGRRCRIRYRLSDLRRHVEANLEGGAA